MRIEPPLCPRCGRPQAGSILCPTCAARTQSISAIRSVFRLEGAARRAIHELKYNNLRAIAPVLATYLNACLPESGFEPDAIVPVPLHPSRERLRGYNQAGLLATALARISGIRLATGLLTRVKDAGSQVRSRSAGERSRNVEGAFACDQSLVSRLRILLIDDVCTTGATLESCAATLVAAGASHVMGLTVAREI